MDSQDQIPPPEIQHPRQPDAVASVTVEVQVDEPYQGEVDENDLARVVTAALLAEGRTEGQITVVVTDDESMAVLNQQFRGEQGPTDVLSFPFQEPTPGFVSPPEAASYLGDIIIALPFTRKQAAELARPLAEELRLLAVHGALHLLGYDHAEANAEAHMWARQDEILAELTAKP
jgi:probable rRNA maturation factor